MKATILISIMIHIGILTYKIPKPIPQKPKPKQSKINVKLKPKKKITQTKGNEKVDELYMLNDIVSKLSKAIEKEKEDRNFVKELLRKKCTKSYRGIGISYDNFLWQVITKVGSNTPAEKAGLMVGDKITDLSPIRDIYPIGTILTLPIIRNGIMLYINVTVGKICTN